MLFEEPVSIMVGAGAKRDILSIREAAEFLVEWPPSRRGPAYSTAVRACDAVRAGHLIVEQGRRAFREFAKLSHILWPEMDPVIAKSALNGGSQHHV